MRGLLDGGINSQFFERDFFLALELIDADHDLLFLLNRHLRFIGRVLDFVLHVAALDGVQCAAHLVDLEDVFSRALLDLIREIFDQIRTRQRVHRIRHARFIAR